MRKLPFDRYLPSPKTIREHPALRPVSKWLHEPDLWHMNRRSVSGAMLIGLFCAFLPVPFQMLIAVVLGVAARSNLAICVMLVWLTNPLTTPPLMLLSYEIGAWLLNRHIAVGELSLKWDWLRANMGNIGYPLLAGSLFCGAVSGLVGFALVRVGWRAHIVSRWRLRRERRRVRKLLEERDPGAP